MALTRLNNETTCISDGNVVEEKKKTLLSVQVAFSANPQGVFDRLVSLSVDAKAD